MDEVLIGFEKGTANLVTLLDLSAAFDTVDLDKLMQILENHMRTKGMALNWFKSFLFGRHQKVKIGSNFIKSPGNQVWCTTRFSPRPGAFQHLCQKST